MLAFKHSGSLGDIIYSLPTIKSIVNEKGTAANIYLQPDVQDSIPQWAGQRQPYRMTTDQALKLIPLLTEQTYIKHAELYNRQHIDYDLDTFRNINLDLGKGDISRYYHYAFPEALPDTTKEWLDTNYPKEYTDMILVNRTLRYQNPAISYKFLSGRSNVIFVGLANEYRGFILDCPRIPSIVAPDYLTLATWIKGCKLFIGNQSFCFALAEATKIPRILEVYPQAPNVIPKGEQAYDVLTQAAFEKCFNLALESIDTLVRQ